MWALCTVQRIIFNQYTGQLGQTTDFASLLLWSYYKKSFNKQYLLLQMMTVPSINEMILGLSWEFVPPHSRRILNFDIFASQPLARTVLTCRQPLKLSKVNIHQSSPYHDQDQPKYLLTYLTFKWSNENGTQKLPLFFFFFFRVKNLSIVYTVLRSLSRKRVIRAGNPTG